jgi:hypothetical protein
LRFHGDRFESAPIDAAPLPPRCQPILRRDKRVLRRLVVQQRAGALRHTPLSLFLRANPAPSGPIRQATVLFWVGEGPCRRRRWSPSLSACKRLSRVHPTAGLCSSENELPASLAARGQSGRTFFTKPPCPQTKKTARIRVATRKDPGGQPNSIGQAVRELLDRELNPTGDVHLMHPRWSCTSRTFFNRSKPMNIFYIIGVVVVVVVVAGFLGLHL